jgi:hypothetical protein
MHLAIYPNAAMDDAVAYGMLGGSGSGDDLN